MGGRTWRGMEGGGAVGGGSAATEKVAEGTENVKAPVHSENH